ncbi:alpha/beta hydrolase [Mycobacterium colombiense]|uniref:Lysophospholipase n=1 Tax=Mycobacterium colombiense TaxID=339268 RepID=A0A1A2YWW0_9MYCO|nr:alpha/beta fold hydrolase [Mycobacterium colombiense]OBI42510.1 lysophospholipase [Mycobacterium colombiense]
MSDKHVVLVHGSWSRGQQWVPARAAFEERGFTVHTPTLRHHELPLREGAAKIASLSIRDYADDLVALVAALDSPPLLVGHSLGGLLVQLVAARTAHVGLIAACPSSVGPSGLNPTTLGIALPHAFKAKAWAKPVYPPTWQRFRRGVAGRQTEEVARTAFDDLVCESGRVLFFELAMPRLDRAEAAKVDRNAVPGPVLVIAGGQDRIVPPRLARRTAARFTNASYAEIPGSDHMVFNGAALPVTMHYIDDWIAQNIRLTGDPL